MNLDFPSSPTSGQLYPSPPVAGLPVYKWDGEKWLLLGAGDTAVYVSDTPPVGVPDNSLWWESDSGLLYVRYNDGDSTQWVIAVPTPDLGTFLLKGGDTMTGPLTLAADPTAALQAATKQYVDHTPALNDVGRNLIHNPLFNIAQRGAGPWTASSAYTADRWQIGVATDAMSVVLVPATDTMRASIGDEACQTVWQNVFTGNAAAGAFNEVWQRVENVRRLSSKTVTLSFYAVAGVAGLKVGLDAAQVFGSGGSPSAAVIIAASVSTVALTTAWARYSVTFAVPSTAGKTLGTNGDDYTMFRLWFSSGATNFPAVGVQSGTVQLWGVQLEVGSVATPLEKPDPQQDWARCLRFYVASGQVLRASFYAASGAYSSVFVCFPTAMRAPPIVTLGAVSSPTNWSSTQAIDGDYLRFTLWTNSAAAGNCGAVIAGYTASADL